MVTIVLTREWTREKGSLFPAQGKDTPASLTTMGTLSGDAQERRPPLHCPELDEGDGNEEPLAAGVRGGPLLSNK